MSSMRPVPSARQAEKKVGQDYEKQQGELRQLEGFRNNLVRNREENQQLLQQEDYNFLSQWLSTAH